MKLFLICIVMCCVGCGTTVPFSSVERVSVAAFDPLDVLVKFKAEIPERFEIVNSAIFNYWGREMTGIGYVSVDTEKKAVSVVCMNPLGLKLFDLVGTNDQYICNLAVDDVVDSDDFARVAGADVGSVFLNMLPAEGAVVRKKRKSIIFSHVYSGGKLEHEFAGKDGLLVEKRCIEGGKLVRRIRYYEYQKHHGKLLPSGIVMENKKYHYGLVMRLKEVLTVQPENSILN